MADSLAAIVGDYRRRPLALPLAAVTQPAPLGFIVVAPILVELGTALLPATLLGFALIAQISRLVSAPAIGVIRALLDGERAGSALSAAGRQAPERITAAALERLAVIAVTIVVGSVVLLVALVLATAAGAALSAMGVVAAQDGLLVVVFGVMLLFTVGAGVSAVFRVGTEITSRPVSERPAAGLAVARSNPWATGRLVACRTAPWVVILLGSVLYLLLDVVSPPLSVLLILLLAVTGASAVLGTGLERRLAAKLTGPVPSLWSVLPDRRVVAVAALVFLILAVPTFGIRVADARPSPATAAPVGDADAATIVADANFALRHVDHFRDTSAEAYNASSGRMEPMLHYDVGANPTDRQVRFHVNSPDEGSPHHNDRYYADGTLAERVQGNVVPPVHSLLSRRSGDWMVASAPFMSTSNYHRIDLDDTLSRHEVRVAEEDWRILIRSDETVTIGVEDPGRLAPIYGQSAENISADSYVRLVVDASTGRPERLSFYYDVTTADYRYQRHVVVEYREWGRHDVERPAAIGDQRPLELFWDAMAY